MKSIKIICLLLATLCLTSFVLASCEGKDVLPAELEYKVTVKDALGNPYGSEVLVKFMKNGTRVAMQPCDENGVAAKTLATAQYDVELQFTSDENAYYYDADILLTETESATEVILSKKITTEAIPLFAPTGETEAFDVFVGCTYIELSTEARNYFIFRPTEAGKYKFSIIGSENARLGYYGAPHFVQEQNLSETDDNTVIISVHPSMISNEGSGTSTYVLGVDTADSNVNNAILAIERIGDHDKTTQDEPWDIYKKTVDLSQYVLPEGLEIKEFDLTAATSEYDIVFNESDGFYHIGDANGPLVYVRLTKDNQYISCFMNILDRSGVSRYFYDEDGNFERRVSYSECLLEYIAVADEKEGVYPLTEDLKHIIIQRGEYVGWWDIETPGYLFKDINGNNDSSINPELAWLLMCCYAE